MLHFLLTNYFNIRKVVSFTAAVLPTSW